MEKREAQREARRELYKANPIEKQGEISTNFLTMTSLY